MTTIANKKPYVIFIEGADGVGKTTTSNLLLKNIKEKTNLLAFKTTITAASNAGADIRQINITEHLSDELRFVGYCFATFYGLKCIFEFEHENPADVIIVDRSQASTFAQNICAATVPSMVKNNMVNIFRNLENEFRSKYQNRFSHVYLYMDPVKALDRIARNRQALDVLETRGVEYQRSIARGYESYYRNFDSKDLLTFNMETVANEVVVNEITSKLQNIFSNQKCQSMI